MLRLRSGVPRSAFLPNLVDVASELLKRKTKTGYENSRIQRIRYSNS